MTLKLNIGDPKSGKTITKELTDDDSKSLIGKKIGDKVSGTGFGLSGYEFQVTGGSDNAGFPMRADVTGAGRKRILITRSVGLQAKRKGLRRKRTVAGNTVSKSTAQLNLKVLKHGSAPLAAAKPEGEAPADDSAAEKPPAKAGSEEKAEAKAKEKKEEPKEEKQAEPEEKSEETKAEEKKEE